MARALFLEMAKVGTKLRKGTFNYSYFRLGFHSNSRSIHSDSDSDGDNTNSYYSSNWGKPHEDYNYSSNWDTTHDILSLWEKAHDNNNKLPGINGRFDLEQVLSLNVPKFVIHLFKQMCDIGFPVVSQCSMTTVIKYYSRLKSTHHGFTFLGYFFKRGIRPNVEIYNTLLDGFILEHKTHRAERLFKNIIFQLEDVCEPNVVTYNIMIKGLCKVGNYFTAIGLMRLMDVRGCNPDLVTYNTIIHGLCNDLFIDDAFMLFKQIKAIHPNVVTYNSLISALCELDRWDEVSSFLKQMQDENISPDVPTFTILLDAFAKKGNMNEAELVFDLLSRSGYYPDIMTYNSLIHGYCLRGEMIEAEEIFDSMGVTPNIHTYNTLLEGYVKLSMLDKAKHLEWDLMRREPELGPDKVTEFIMEYVYEKYDDSSRSHCLDELSYTNRLESVCVVFQIEEALSFFRYGDAHNYNSSACHYNYVIECARKCGNLDIARLFFRYLHVKRVDQSHFTYEATISCLCEEGVLKEAKQIVYKMEKSGRWEVSPCMIGCLSNGYMRFKPFDEILVFIHQFEQRIYYVYKTYELYELSDCIGDIVDLKKYDKGGIENCLQEKESQLKGHESAANKGLICVS